MERKTGEHIYASFNYIYYVFNYLYRKTNGSRSSASQERCHDAIHIKYLQIILTKSRSDLAMHNVALFPKSWLCQNV